MRPTAALAGAVATAALCSGCGLTWIPYDVTPTPMPPPVVAAEPTPSVTPTPEVEAYSGELGKKAKCVTLKATWLEFFEAKGLVGGAVTYPRGAMVKANGDWWAVAVATQVNPNSVGKTSSNVAPFAYFVSTEPTDEDGYDRAFTRPVSTEEGGEALDMARTCLAKVPTPKPTPPPGSPATYTGKLARGAKCTAVSPAMLGRLQEVGQVGGAITYPRGEMVRANGKWWTVAVATQVNPNSAGLSADDVPATAVFVTNAPSYKASSKARIVYFPLNPTKRDTSAAKALKCLAAG